MKQKTRGLGRIFKPKNSRFWHCAYYRYDGEHRESTRVEILDPDPNQKSENAARRFLNKKIDEVRAERAGGPTMVTPEQKRVTIGELLDGLQLDYSTRRKWSKQTASLVKAVRAYFGCMRAVDLAKTHVTAYIAKLQGDGFADSSINRRVQILMQSFTIADRVPPAAKRLSEVGNERQGYYTRSEIMRVHAFLPDYLKDFWLFDCFCGWRLSALRKLKWSDVESDKVILRAINSKNRRPFTLPLSVPIIREIIDRRRQDRRPGCDFIFHYTVKDRTRPVGDIRKSLANAFKLARVPFGTRVEGGKTFHDMRRTAYRNLILAGVPESVAMQICGHVTSAMAKRYSIVSEDQKEAALLSVAAYHRAQDERQPMLTTQLQ